MVGGRLFGTGLNILYFYIRLCGIGCRNESSTVQARLSNISAICLRMRQVLCFYPVSFQTITHGRHAKPAKLEFVSLKQNGAGKIFATNVIFMCSEIIFLLLVNCKAVFYRNNGCCICQKRFQEGEPFFFIEELRVFFGDSF